MQNYTEKLDPLAPDENVSQPDTSLEHLNPTFGNAVKALIQVAKDKFNLTLYVRETFRSRDRQDWLNKNWKHNGGGYAPDIYNDDGEPELDPTVFPHGSGFAVDLGIQGHEKNEAPLHKTLHALFFKMFPKEVSELMIEGDENHYQASDELISSCSKDLENSPHLESFLQKYEDPKEIDDPKALYEEKPVVKSLLTLFNFAKAKKPPLSPEEKAHQARLNTLAYQGRELSFALWKAKKITTDEWNKFKLELEDDPELAWQNFNPIVKEKTGNSLEGLWEQRVAANLGQTKPSQAKPRTPAQPSQPAQKPIQQPVQASQAPSVDISELLNNDLLKQFLGGEGAGQPPKEEPVKQEQKKVTKPKGQTRNIKSEHLALPIEKIQADLAANPRFSKFSPSALEMAAHKIYLQNRGFTAEEAEKMLKGEILTPEQQAAHQEFVGSQVGPQAYQKFMSEIQPLHGKFNEELPTVVETPPVETPSNRVPRREPIRGKVSHPGLKHQGAVFPPNPIANSSQPTPQPVAQPAPAVSSPSLQAPAAPAPQAPAAPSKPVYDSFDEVDPREFDLVPEPPQPTITQLADPAGTMAQSEVLQRNKLKEQQFRERKNALLALNQHLEDIRGQKAQTERLHNPMAEQLSNVNIEPIKSTIKEESKKPLQEPFRDDSTWHEAHALNLIGKQIPATNDLSMKDIITGRATKIKQQKAEELRQSEQLAQIMAQKRKEDEDRAAGKFALHIDTPTITPQYQKEIPERIASLKTEIPELKSQLKGVETPSDIWKLVEKETWDNKINQENKIKDRMKSVRQVPILGEVLGRIGEEIGNTGATIAAHASMPKNYLKKLDEFKSSQKALASKETELDNLENNDFEEQYPILEKKIGLGN